jgi:hypothetical protein
VDNAIVSTATGVDILMLGHMSSLFGMALQQETIISKYGIYENAQLSYNNL